MRRDPCDVGAACAGCAAGSSRRDFLRDMIAFSAAALATLGASGEVAAEGLRWTSAIAGHGPSVRYPVPAEDGVQIDRDNQVILVRWQGAAYAFALSCPHQNTALRWQAGESRFQCPKHKSKYTPDGTFISGRATRGMDRYAITRQGAALEVDTATLHEQDRDPAAWAAAMARLD